jgi:hypothetical protein
MNYIERTTKGTRWEASLDGGKTWHRGGPVSFTAENAQKCFDGLKTQTRRLLRPQPSANYRDGIPFTMLWDEDEQQHWRRDIKPSFAVGDIFYIREPWRTDMAHDKIKPTDLPGGAPILFDCALDPKGYLNPGKLRPAMFLQRRFARPARYQVTEVRCERVNEISEKDAEAEGIEWRQYGIYPKRSTTICRNGFEKLWNSINTKPGTRFEDNPWVWAYTFRRVR